MNCQQVQDSIERLIDGLLETTQANRVAAHMDACQSCQQCYEQQKAFLTTLSQLTVPAPPVGYHARVLNKARQTNIEYRKGFSYGLKYGFISAFAAGLAMVLVLAWLVLPQRQTELSPLVHLNMQINESKVVQLVFDSPTELENATIALQLPEGISFVNSPNKRSLTWKTDFMRGKNRLRLPIKASGASGGKVIAELKHNDERKIFIIDVSVDDKQVSIRKWGNYSLRNG